ncbi:hypothetical protein DFH94DRAFT_686455 [Russula ochroleuca]|uniref:Uncharacterized protein n=1 Tax=Russula ochroleuca TaxID=152965 RepID=A0A9P5JVS2_9AGAM|nr:hypothetical protein DFH94DRAFT_686455 [Russula ochroleuca]
MALYGAVTMYDVQGAKGLVHQNLTTNYYGERGAGAGVARWGEVGQGWAGQRDMGWGGVRQGEARRGEARWDGVGWGDVTRGWGMGVGRCDVRWDGVGQHDARWDGVGQCDTSLESDGVRARARAWVWACAWASSMDMRGKAWGCVLAPSGRGREHQDLVSWQMRGCVVGKGEGEGVWWAKAWWARARARACGGRRQGHVVRRRTREGEQGTNKGAKSVDGRRSETENINIEHMDVELSHMMLRYSAPRNVLT